MADMTGKYNGVDRRKYPRVNARIKYEIIEKELARKFGKTKNISAGGIAFFVKDKINENTILSLIVDLPDETEFLATAQVVWQEKIEVSWDDDINYELGVKFIQINKTDREKISKYAFLRLNKG